MAKFLSELSDELAETAAKAGKSVVRVEGRRRLPASGIACLPTELSSPLTTVVERDDQITVGLPDGGAIAAALAGRDPTTDWRCSVSRAKA